jgi:hypothetical protein
VEERTAIVETPATVAQAPAVVEQQSMGAAPAPETQMVAKADRN